MKHLLRIILSTIAVIAYTTSYATTKPTMPSTDSRLRELYIQIYKNLDNEKCVALADSFINISKQKGDQNGVIHGMFFLLKHECTKDDNFKNVKDHAKRIMDYSLKHNFTEQYYSAVSHYITYLTNKAKYSEAIKYQNKIMLFAKEHKHYYGIILGHISLGNLYRMRLQLPQAIDEFKQAIEGYKEYDIKRDVGNTYKRIAECYLIQGNFHDGLACSSDGIEASTSIRSISGLYGYKAFCLFMLDRKEEFRKAYANYKKEKDIQPDIMPFVANCLETMKLIDEGNYSEAEKRLAGSSMGAFKLYVELAYYTSQKKYADVLRASKELHINLFGDSKGTFTTYWGRISEEINNNLTEIDKQREAYKNSQLKLTETKLQLKNTQLELFRFKDAEQLARMSSDAKHISYNNHKLYSKQLKDSLNNQKLRHKMHEQKIESDRMKLFATLVSIFVLFLFSIIYLRYNNRVNKFLKARNNDLRKILSELSIANDEAQESDRKKTEFIQNISHEVRTPLNTIVGFSQILATAKKDDISEDDRKQITQIINQSSAVLNTIITDILDLTSIESGKYITKDNDTYVNDLCRTAIDNTCQRKAADVDIRFVSDLSDTFCITTDKQRILQVITNMLTNAIKNTEHGSITLSCTTKEHKGMLTISVADTGVGIPADLREKIFERFFKVDKFKQGAGLGLNICQAIATKMGGTMALDPNYTDGARFYFTLPLNHQ